MTIGRHFDWHGRCYGIRGPDATIHAIVDKMRPHIRAHGSHVSDGTCHCDGGRSGEWADGVHWRVCADDGAEVPADDINLWDGGRTLHAVAPSGKACMQFSGTPMRDPAIDNRLDGYLKTKGMSLDEGSCASAGFTAQYAGYHANHHGIHVTVWT